jgi:hypothetical protein
VILHGKSIAFLVLNYRLTTSGIVQDVTVLVTQLLSVVMAHVMVMKITTHVQRIVMLQAHVMRVMYLTVMVQMSAGQNHGSVTDSKIVKINNTVLT